MTPCGNPIAVSPTPSRLTNCRYLVVNYGWTKRRAFAMLRALDFGASVAEARRAAERS